MRGYSKYIILSIIISLSSCELGRDLDIELPEGEPLIVVEAYLVEGMPFEILLFESNLLTEPVRLNLIWNASVNIIETNDTIRLRNLIKFDEDNSFLYNYLQDSIVKSSAKEYKLYIDKEGMQPISALSKPVGPVLIDTIEYYNDILMIKSENSSDPRDNYYQLRLYKYIEGILSDIQQIEADMHHEPQGEIEIKCVSSFDNLDSVRVDLYRIDSTAYSYHRSISNSLGANRDPFTTPTPFMGNLNNAWGIFTCTSKDSYTIVL